MTAYSSTKYPSSTELIYVGNEKGDWSNRENLGADDGAYAGAYYARDGTYLGFPPLLHTYGHGFSIPSSATIQGVKVEVERKANNNAPSNYVQDYLVQLLYDTTYSNNKAIVDVNWSTSDTVITYGGNTDLWGLTITPAIINSSSFGVAFRTKHKSADADTYVDALFDYIRITVYYDVPSPTPPSGLSTTNFDATNSQPLTWSWQPTFTGDAITACRVQIIDVSTGSTTYDSGKVASTIPAFNLSANTLTNNKQYQWKVLVYDSLDRASSYSSLATFYTSAAPTATITYPANNGDTIATSSLTVTWTYSDPESGAQSAYQAMLLDSDQKILENTGKVSTAGLSKTFSYAFANNTNYRVAVYVWDNKGVASLMSVRTFTVSYTPPAKPTLAISADTTRGSAGLTITNPTPGAGQPAVSYNDIYRKKSTETDYIRIATSVAEDGAWTDYTLASGVEYDYIIRAFGTDGSYADSDAVDITLTLTAPQIALASNYSTYLDIAYLVGVSESRNYNKSMVVFAGREAPVAEFSEHVNMEMTLSIIMDDYADVETLIGYMETKETLLYRDYRGRREFVTVGSIEVQDNGSHFTVGLTLERTSYSEVV